MRKEHESNQPTSQPDYNGGDKVAMSHAYHAVPDPASISVARVLLERSIFIVWLETLLNQYKTVFILKKKCLHGLFIAIKNKIILTDTNKMFVPFFNAKIDFISKFFEKY